MTTERQIVCVWLDDTSDDRGWVVDTDTVEGGESDTLRVFPPTNVGLDRAVSFGKETAKKRGCDLHILNDIGTRIVCPADEIDG